MASKDTLTLFNLYVDGVGYAGSVEELNLPNPTLKTEEFRAGGMDMPEDVDMGMEKLTMNFSIAKYDKHSLSLLGQSKPFTIRGSIRDEESGDEVPMVINATAKTVGIEHSAWKAGEHVPAKYNLSLSRYKLSLDGKVMHDISANPPKRVINGVDHLKQARANIGL